jgi:hypothetical protein
MEQFRNVLAQRDFPGPVKILVSLPDFRITVVDKMPFEHSLQQINQHLYEADPVQLCCP